MSKWVRRANGLKKKILTLCMAIVVAVLGMLFAGNEVQAEETYTVPFTAKYDIGNETFIFDFTLDTEEDLYLAYYCGYGERDELFEKAIFTGSKSATITAEETMYGLTYSTIRFVNFWVVDKDNNLVADAYPMYMDEVLTEDEGIYKVFSDGGRYYTDKAYAESVEYINGEDLSAYDLEPHVRKGQLYLYMPEMEGTPQVTIQAVLYLNGERVGWDVMWVNLRGIQAAMSTHHEIDTSGEYTIVYWLEGDGIRTRNRQIKYVYERPDKQVSAPSNLSWGETEKGKITFTQSDTSGIGAYECWVRTKREYEDTYWTGSGYTSQSENFWYDSTAGIYEIDFCDTLESYGENCIYRIEARAYSSDIEEYAHSDWVYSDIYDPTREKVLAFVERMYTVALGRDAETDGSEWWTDALMNGDSDGAGLAYGFLIGDEFKSKGYSNAEYVAVLYATFFNREIAEGEGDFWISALESGTSRESVLSGFVNSEEFFSLCAEYGILRGVMLEDGTAVNSGIGKFAERLYTEVLERDGEEGGMEYWGTAIAKGECTPEDAAKSFFTSDEYLIKNSTDAEYVKALYRTFMGRECDTDGLNYWVNALATEVTREKVLNDFAVSEEFKQIMAGYGL